MIEAILYSSNVWLIIGLTLAIIELTNGTLIFFLPMGISGLIVGFMLKLQEDGTSFIILNDRKKKSYPWVSKNFE